MSANQEEQVKQFFDRTAKEYRKKYGKEDVFYEYFFGQRLKEAVRDFDLNGTTVLDIGAGTGNLYDFLLNQFDSINYYATDIAGEMLNQSKIPTSRRFVGACYEVDLPLVEYDYIFLLGVTTYLDELEYDRVLSFIHKSLKPGGTAIISYTNGASFNQWHRQILAAPMRWLAPSNKLLGSDIKIKTYQWKSLRSSFGQHFEIQELRLLNQAVFPFYLLLPKFSVKLAEFFHCNLPRRGLLRLLSSDLLVILNKQA